MGTALERASAIYDISERASSYDMANEVVDGQDVLIMHAAMERAVERARTDKVPTLLEVRTYRFMGHSMSDPIHGHYRTKEEVEEQRKRDPIAVWSQRLIAEGLMDEAAVKALDKEVIAEVEDAYQFADEAPDPDADELYRTYMSIRERDGGQAHGFASFPAPAPGGGPDRMAVLTYRDALNQALREEMQRDPTSSSWARKSASYKGAYKVSRGLLEEFGPMRVVDTPITELGFAGVGVGAAMVGLRPVIEFMTWNFALLAIDQIVNSAAKMRYMSGGQVGVPIVFRGPGRRGAPARRAALAGVRELGTRTSPASRW